MAKIWIVREKHYFFSLHILNLMSCKNGNGFMLVNLLGLLLHLGLEFPLFFFQAKLTGQIGHSVANGLPPLQHLFEKSCVKQCNDAKMSPANSLHASGYYSEYNETFDLIYSPNTKISIF